MTRLRCVLLSPRLDLRTLCREALDEVSGVIEFVDDPAASPGTVRMALAWEPSDDAFRPYPGLAAVCSIGAGVDNLVACPSLRADLPLVRVVDPGQARTMSAFVLWHVVGRQRRFRTYATNQKARWWRYLAPPEAGSVPVGILGYGSIGRRVAADLANLGFPVSAWGRTPREPDAGVTYHHGPDGLRALLGGTEILINLLPLTCETRGLIDAAFLDRLPRGAYLIQVGRGEHLVEADLLAALDSGRLAGAALDVFAVEPLPDTHPFWYHPEIFVTPHEACHASQGAIARMLASTADAVGAGRHPPDTVDTSRGY